MGPSPLWTWTAPSSREDSESPRTWSGERRSGRFAGARNSFFGKCIRFVPALVRHRRPSPRPWFAEQPP